MRPNCGDSPVRVTGKKDPYPDLGRIGVTAVPSQAYGMRHLTNRCDPRVGEERATEEIDVYVVLLSDEESAACGRPFRGAASVLSGSGGLVRGRAAAGVFGCVGRA